MATHAEIELPFGYRAPSIHCPACGAVVSEEGECRGCPHAIFMHLGDLGDFTYVAASHRGVLDAIYEDEDVDHVLAEFVCRLDRPSVLALTVHSGGMGQGPLWYTETLAFDFAPEHQ